MAGHRHGYRSVTVDLDDQVVEQMKVYAAIEHVSFVSILRALTRQWANDPAMQAAIRDDVMNIHREAIAQRAEGRRGMT